MALPVHEAKVKGAGRRGPRDPDPACEHGGGCPQRGEVDEVCDVSRLSFDEVAGLTGVKFVQVRAPGLVQIERAMGRAKTQQPLP